VECGVERSADDTVAVFDSFFTRSTGIFPLSYSAVVMV